MTTPIIFDTDPGIDDAMAILFAHASPALELVGITTSFGNANIEQTTRNAFYLQQTFGLGCPVHQGVGQPLHIPLDAPADFVHGKDGLGDTGLQTAAVEDGGDAVKFIIDTVRARPGEITLVAVGRMTNLALAAMQAPDIVAQVKAVVIMGGALGRHGIGGNVTPCAEANIYGDPHAADIVVRSAWPLTMVGLDVTMQTVMTPDRLADIAQRGGQAGQFIEAISHFYQNFYRQAHGLEGFPVHDSSALAYVVAPELFEVAQGGLRVVTEGLALGQTLLADKKRHFPFGDWQSLPVQQVCVEVQDQAVLDLYQQTLLNE